MVRIDMSEYQERHTVSRLIGAPPGYVGYEESGQLTEAVRRKPYAVVLLDEIEKAHPDVFNVLLQVLDDGRLTDNKGRTVDFKNTIIIMTSNIGSTIIRENLEQVTENNRKEILNRTREQVFDLLKKSIRPEFLNRVDEIIMFQPLTREEIEQVVTLQVNLIRKMLEKNDIRLEATAAAIHHLASIGFDPQYGARPIKRVLQKYVLNELSKRILEGKVDKETVIRLDEKAGQLSFENVSDSVN
jgi:ATP-dependent Clp protease ATP-binding subunit ClpB